MKKNLIILGATAAIAIAGMAAPSFAAREKMTREQRVDMIIKRMDTNSDKKVSLDEVEARAAAAFKALDADGNGEVTPDEIKAKRTALQEARKTWAEARDKAGPEKKQAMEALRSARTGMLPGVGGPKLFARADTDKNGSLSMTEVSQLTEKMFKRRDTNGDGFIDASDFTKKI